MQRATLACVTFVAATVWLILFGGRQVPAAAAQRGTLRVAIANPARIILQMAEKTAMQDKFDAKRKELEAKVEQQKNTIATLIKQKNDAHRGDAQPGSASPTERARRALLRRERGYFRAGDHAAERQICKKVM